ncbi:MAG: hypothetical protein ACR2NW_00860 [Thermodesulfobacteriota bacterium]
MNDESRGYWKTVWIEFKKDRMALISLLLIFFLGFIAIFQNFIAGNKPILLVENGEVYLPAVFNYPELSGVDIKKSYIDKKDVFIISPPIKYSPTEMTFTQF